MLISFFHTFLTDVLPIWTSLEPPESLKFYKFYEEHIIHLESVMNRENSIQLVYQLSILIHNFLNYPVIELVYQNKTPGVKC